MVDLFIWHVLVTLNGMVLEHSCDLNAVVYALLAQYTRTAK
jgi:hypothetical protein